MESSEIIEAIREALKRKGTNPSRLAKDNGLSINAVRYILEGRAPSSRRLAQVCDALDLEFYVGPPRLPHGTRLDASQLADELDRLSIEARHIAHRQWEGVARVEDDSPYVSAPRYEVLAAAGSGATVGEETIKGYLGFTKTWLRDQRLMAEKLAVIEVRGDSMDPTLRNGDIVLLDMRTPQLRDGDIYTLRKEDELLVKRLRRQGSNWLLVSDNVSYPVEPLDGSVAVIGRVVWLGRTFGNPA